MFIQAAQIDLRPRNLGDFLVQGQFRAIISGQSFKLAESIGSMSLKAATTVFARLLGSFRMMMVFRVLSTSVSRNDFWSLPKMVSISK
ncbi:hypothetical protein ACZ87_00635 [Candidatus Erwinia dacicola]|uniref:Uncharacterized protein n=2 Tax=Candidatus Erwinia dacicola TaxID=252393 RepID=A0A328TXQ4_9GAMM|nr:hypothetical protein ACZ87_00635 [Candidatus Erwinia dacicola]